MAKANRLLSFSSGTPELYASLMQKRSDGTRDYSASTGTVKLTSVNGAFKLHFGSVLLTPPGVADGALSREPGEPDVTGTFVVLAPSAAHP